MQYEPNRYDGQHTQPYQPYIEYINTMASQQPGLRPAAVQTVQRPAARPAAAPMPARMSKAEALLVIGSLKKWLVVSSVVGFGILGGLVVAHTTGVTSQTQQTTPTNTSTTQDNGGFFQQQQGGFGFGNGNSSQSPFSGTRTS